MQSSLEVIVDGLAVSHFVQENNLWEFVFPRQYKNHQLSIEIVKVDSNNQESARLKVDSVKIGDKISIKNSDPIASAGMEKFDEMLDLSKLHNEPIHFREDTRYKATYLSVNDAVFRRLQMSEPQEVWEVKYDDEGNAVSKTLKETKSFGKSVVGKIECNDSSETIFEISGSVNLAIPLKHENGTKYRISFDNDCHEEKLDGISDFQAYYDELIDISKLSGITYELTHAKNDIQLYARQGSPCGGVFISWIAAIFCLEELFW